MPNNTNDNARALTLLILLALIWGTSFILMKKGLVVFSPGELGSIRVAAASIFLLPIAIIKLKELQNRHYLQLFASGLMGIFFPAFLFALAQTRLESSVTGIMNSLTPIFTLIIGVLFFQQTFRRQSIIGIVIGLIGTVILILANSGGEIQGVNLYALLVILACLFYATNLNYIKYKIPDLKALTITSVSLMLIGPLALLYLFGFTEFSQKLSGQEGAWTAFGFILLLGFMSTSLATILFNKLVKISSPLYTSSVTYLIPIVAVLWGLFDDEQLFPGHIAGMAAIIGGVYLANRRA
ncbi:MAG: DMT family transporter [Cyclobacteriaceae bacterium]